MWDKLRSYAAGNLPSVPQDSVFNFPFCLPFHKGDLTLRLPTPSALLRQFSTVVVPASLSEQHDERSPVSDARWCSLGALVPHELALCPRTRTGCLAWERCQSPEPQILASKAT